MTRKNSREPHQHRPIEVTSGYIQNAEGSCLFKMGNTWVLATASVEEKIPPFLEKKTQGWVTAEYAMLPRATHTRSPRESVKGKQSGRTQEIQRLIGRAMRACINLDQLGPRTITLDCDILQADGGTRVASINGAYIAMHMAVQKLIHQKKINHNPIHSIVSAISVGIKENKILVDLDYEEDSSCDVDLNVVMCGDDRLIEIQGTAEHQTFSTAQLEQMIEAAKTTIQKISETQKKFSV